MTVETPSLWSETIRHLKLKSALTASITDQLGICLEKMRSGNDPFLIILDHDDHISGVYTERDAMNSFMGTNLSKLTEVGAIMNHNNISISPDKTVREAMSLMGDHHVNQLPVFENNKIIGVLTVETLLEYLSECFPEELINQPPQRVNS